MQASRPDQGEKESQGKNNPALSKVIESIIRSIIHLRAKTLHEYSLRGRIPLDLDPPPSKD